MLLQIDERNAMLTLLYTKNRVVIYTGDEALISQFDAAFGVEERLSLMRDLKDGKEHTTQVYPYTDATEDDSLH